MEDDAVVALALGDYLDRRRYAVVGIAANAQQALAIAEEALPDLVIMDVNLSDTIDGVTIARELHRKYAAKIVFATASGDRVASDGRDIASAILIKPYAASEVADVLDRLLRAA
ncbi:MAG: response regulator [Rhodospirillales bacterium]